MIQVREQKGRSSKQRASFSRPEVSVVVRWMRWANLRSIPVESRSGSGMARPMLEMLGMWSVAGRDEHLFRARWKDFLQIRLHTVRFLMATEKRHELLT